MCWGRNHQGQLGTGNTSQSNIPTIVEGLGSGVVSISAGDAHSCAVTDSGSVACWGQNTNGKLGDGTTTQRTFPVPVRESTLDALTGVLAVSAGSSHTCATMVSGGVKCWGLGNRGQLGNGTTASSSFPVDVAWIGTSAVAISAGGEHTCALTSTGDVLCWGFNGQGQLGNNTVVNYLAPVLVSGIGPGALGVSAGDNHTCAITADGRSKCWGNNQNGKLGDSSIVQKQVPSQVSNLTSGSEVIAAGMHHSCAIVVGKAWCWGRNDNGQLGTGSVGGGANNAPLSVLGL